VCLCIRICLPDGEFVEVEMCRRNTNRQMIINYFLFDFLDQVQYNDIWNAWGFSENKITHFITNTCVEIILRNMSLFLWKKKVNRMFVNILLSLPAML